KRRLGAVRRLGAQHAMTPSAAQAREEIVGPQARSELPPAHRAAGIDRVDEAHRAYQMRGKAAQPLALAGGLEDEPHLALLEVAEPFVDQLRRAARRPRSEIGLLDQSDAQAAERGVARYAGAVDASPDDQQVEALSLEGIQRGLSPGRALHDLDCTRPGGPCHGASTGRGPLDSWNAKDFVKLGENPNFGMVP